jgi:hypothetical protein
MRKLLSAELPGRWTLLGYNEQTKTYVLGGLFEIGAWLPVREIQYLTVDEPKLRPAKINEDDEWYALGTRTSPDGRLVAFVGRHTYLGKPPHAAPKGAAHSKKIKTWKLPAR